LAAEKAEFLESDIAALRAKDPTLSAEDALRLAERGRSAGRFLIATVKGDVHDIGKNIVGVVLACNGFEVTDMGVMVSCDQILDKAIEIGADAIGLSGLITPSLDEMVHVAQEMERRGFRLPLLVGGATTSAAHTAIKIAPHYSGPVIHVLDASRSVPVTTSLLSATQRDTFVADHRAKQQTLRENFLAGPVKKTLTLAQARAAAPQWDWAHYTPPVPSFLGVRGAGRDGRAADGPNTRPEASSCEMDLRALIDCIDWSPFFHTWNLRGVWDPALKVLKTQNAAGAAEAATLYQDALAWIERIIATEAFHARGVFGFFPANADGDDIIVWSDEDRATERCRLHTLRQQLKKDSGKPHLALADWLAPCRGGPRHPVMAAPDYIGGFVVGIHGADELSASLDAAHDPYGAIMVKALADRFAEAAAEALHHRARVAWGYETHDDSTPESWLLENYRGIRPAPGYPAQPDHSEKPTLFALLEATQHTGVTLTESSAMHPGAAVCGLYFSHPQSRYFGISNLLEDQVDDYARRKGITRDAVQKSLGPWLGYVP
ncbi:MAG: methionine synthase, partial [Verrucomicrobiota bacterium]